MGIDAYRVGRRGVVRREGKRERRGNATRRPCHPSNSVGCVYRQRSSDSAPRSSAVAADGTGALRSASAT